MKKIVSFSALVAATLFMTACGGSSNDSGNAGTTPATGGGNNEQQAEVIPGGVAEDGSLYGSLNIMSFVPDPVALSLYFEHLNPDVSTSVSITGLDGGAFQTQLQQILASNTNVPDLVMMDAQFVRQFVESPFLSDIDFMLDHVADLDIYQFTLDAGTHEGTLRAISHQATPGVMYVRRSLALEFFGTDDPDELQEYFKDLDTFLDSARRIRDMSGGTTFALPAYDELVHMIWANREQPWIVDNNLVIDPMVEQYMDIARVLRDENLEAQVGTWSGEWFAGMSDTLVNAAGTPIQIFGYFLPTWGLHGTLMHNATTDDTDTTGDWMIIPGPLPYQWGGSWFAIPNNAPNPELAREFLEWFFTEDIQAKWMTGFFTHDRVLEWSTDIPGDTHISAGDFMSSNVVNERNKAEIVGTTAYEFVGGQNPHDVFAQVAPNVSLRLIQGTDFMIQDAFGDALSQYINNEVTREQALEIFRDSVSIDLPNLNVRP